MQLIKEWTIKKVLYQRPRTMVGPPTLLCSRVICLSIMLSSCASCHNLLSLVLQASDLEFKLQLVMNLLVHEGTLGLCLHIDIGDLDTIDLFILGNLGKLINNCFALCALFKWWWCQWQWGQWWLDFSARCLWQQLYVTHLVILLVIIWIWARPFRLFHRKLGIIIFDISQGRWYTTSLWRHTRVNTKYK